MRDCELYSSMGLISDPLPNPEQPGISLFSSRALSLSPIQHPQQRVQELRHYLRDCGLYSGMGLICEESDFITMSWKPAVKRHLSSLNYKIINDIDLPAHMKGESFFTTIAQSIAPPKPHASTTCTVAESSDSPPFVIAVVVSGWIEIPCQLLYTCNEEISIDDIIQPFLPQSAPHLQHIPKLFFITVRYRVSMDPHSPPPRFPKDPDGNYCIVYHMAGTMAMIKWVEDITNDLFVHGMTVQGAIEKSRSRLNKDEENLYYFTCLKKNLVLKK